MKSHEFRDLARLARERCRTSAMSVAQLLDEDQEKAALLVSCALDFINGATVMLANEDVSEHEALGTVLGMLLSSLGLPKVAAALKAAKVGR